MGGILLQMSYLVAVGFCFTTFGWLLLRADQNKTTKALMICQVLIMIWCLPQLFLPFAATSKMKYVLYGVSYIGISLIGPCWLEFSWSYCKNGPSVREKEKRISSWIRGVLFGIAIFDYGMFLTNRWHHLFYLYFDLEQVVYGPVFYFHMAYAYGCVILGMCAVLGNFRKHYTAAVHAAVIVLAAAIPLCFNILYLSGIIKTGFDLTPPVFAVSSFLLLVAVFRYDFLDVNVAASRHIFASITEGVVVYNKREKITYCNDAAVRWLHVQNGDDYRHVREKLFENGESVQPAVVLDLKEGGKIQAKQYRVLDRRGRETAGVLMLTDVGEYYEIVRQSRELAVTGQRLAIEKERNRIAQEVHDTTGHTLTMIQSLIKLIRIRYEDRKRQGEAPDSELEEYVGQAQELASSGIRELRWAINHMRQGDSCELLTQGVYQLAGSVKEIQVEVEIQGEDGPQYSHLSPVVYQCVREAITNCLKYAGASRMDVIIKFGESSVSVYIFDDGRGCGSIKAHNGLAGMETRVKEAGGKIRFLSAQGEGFQIFFELQLGGSRDSGSNSR